MAAAVQELEQTFRSDVTRGANALPELLALCWPATPADEETAFHALRAVVRCFRSAWANNVFRLALLPAARRDAQLDQLAAHAEQRDALRTLVAWVLRQHEDAFDACVALMAHSEAGLHVAAVDAMAELMQLEIAVRLNERAQVELRSQTLFEALHALVWTDEDTAVRAVHPRVLEALARSFFAFSDARYHCWRAVGKLVRDGVHEEPSLRAALCSVCLDLARAIGVPDAAPGATLLPVTHSADKALALQKRAFSDMWTALMASPMTKSAYKSILLSVDVALLPYLKHPVSVVDFCMAAYQMGGHTSLLSLQSLFVISTKLNIEVPDFYPKLYALLCTEAIFVSKYRQQLWELTDVFLSSEYLPLAFAAAFLKKLCRLALRAPAHGAMLCLQLAFNIVRRHPNTLVLVQADEAADLAAPDTDAADADDVDKLREAPPPSKKARRWRRAEPVDRRAELRAAQEAAEAADDFLALAEGGGAEDASGDEQEGELAADAPRSASPDREALLQQSVGVANMLAEDPFDDTQLDPGETHALQSSLWELLALQHHHVPEVADLALVFSRDMQRPLNDIASAASASTRTLLEKMRRKKTKYGVPLEHRLRPSIVPETLSALWQTY